MRMSAKKIIFVSIAAVFVLMAATVIYLYTQFNQVSTLAEHIPERATTVVYINSKKMAELFFSGRIKTDSVLDPSTSYVYLKRIPDIKRTGINLLGDAAYIQYQNYQYILVSLQDVKQFEQTLTAIGSNLLNQTTEMGTYKKTSSQKDSFTIAWTGTHMVFIPKKNPPLTHELLTEILTTKSIESFAKNTHFLTIKKEDALLWFYSPNISLKISKPSPIKGYLKYDTSIVIVGTDAIANPYELPVFYEPAKAPTNFIYADSGNYFINKNLKDLSTLFLQDEVEKIGLFNLNNYKKAFCLLGYRLLESKQITYQYDDNFNKTKIETVSIDSIQGASFILSSLKTNESIYLSNLVQFKSYSPFDLQAVPSNVKLIAHIDRAFLSSIYPTNFDYHAKLIHQKDKGNNVYKIELNVPTLKALIKSL